MTASIIRMNPSFVRILAQKLPKKQAERARKRKKGNASRKQRNITADTLLCAGWVVVLTSLGAEYSGEEILHLYRSRWQVELVFKRLKSLLQLGSIPTKTEEAGETWINGKILLSLLTEKYLGDIDFSPSWNICSQPEYREGDEAGILYNFYDAATRYPDGLL